jgi:hypothetical protein
MRGLEKSNTSTRKGGFPGRTSLEKPRQARQRAVTPAILEDQMFLPLTGTPGRRPQRSSNVRRPGYLYLSIILLLTLAMCAGTGKGIKALNEPQDQGVLILGDVIVENINQALPFDTWDFGFDVVIIGRGAGDTLRHYTVTTDTKGYFCLPNVPAGQYALKAVILQVAGGLPVKIVNDLASDSPVFYRMRHPERPIEYSAEWLPPEVEGNIVNLGITWLGLREAILPDYYSRSIGSVLVEESAESLKAKRFYSGGYPHTRVDPLTHFKERFPDSRWWSR